MEKTNSGNLSKGDIISFVALIILGIFVFFGLNISTLGDKVPSAIIALVITVLMIVFVFLAGYAKAQDRYREKWQMVEYAMLAFFIIGLVPCYLYTAKFFDVQFGKKEISKQVSEDIDNLNAMFKDYSKAAERRANELYMTLDAKNKSDEGKLEIARLLEIADANTITQGTLEQAKNGFLTTVKGSAFKRLEQEKNEIVGNVEKHFKNWNLFFIPQVAAEMSMNKTKFAEELETLFKKKKTIIEDEAPEFNTEKYVVGDDIATKFSKTAGFSVIGLIVTLFLGFLGLIKYLFGTRSRVVVLKKGSADIIREDGGFTI